MLEDGFYRGDMSTFQLPKHFSSMGDTFHERKKNVPSSILSIFTRISSNSVLRVVVTLTIAVMLAEAVMAQVKSESDKQS